jgi:DNA-binding transcriptional ArsR family regulator
MPHTLTTPSPTLIWDVSTGYDFFVSLHVLHQPNEFALRGAWAKGVRTRLPGKARAILEETSGFLLSALPWVNSLPAPKDGETILDAFAEIPAAKRLPALLKTPEVPPETAEILDEVADRGHWLPAMRDTILSRFAAEKQKESNTEIEAMLAMVARGAEFGAELLEAFSVYYQVFFAEEESRIRPALQQAVERGQELAATLEYLELLSELSEGIRFEDKMRAFPAVIMIPSFWITPRIFFSQTADGRGLFIHGGRPADTSIVPGETVPDALYLALKALADPTRLRILHYLEEEPLTPSELAAVLRLRAPTVIHHLNTLRLAGLVYVTFGHGDKRYAARTSRITEMYLQLRRYLGSMDAARPGDISGRPPYMA